MPWHSVVISNPARLSRKHCALEIEQDQTAHIPFEDIAIIVLAHKNITLTHPVLSACAEYGVGLFSTGNNYQPNGIFMPFLAHSRCTKVMRQQLSTDKPTAKRTWMHLVRAKISNQAECLRLAQCVGADRVEAFAHSVRSGDPDNIEAQASSLYFRCLFGEGFKRSLDSKANSALNYGYAIVRGCIARLLVAYGFLPAFGLHHHSEQNAFNLADDLIEPIRPIVDLFTRTRIDPGEDLAPADKAALVELLHYDMSIDEGASTVLSCIEKCVMSLGRVLEESNPELMKIPKLLPLNLHKDEC